jgi:hypothetical protein
MSQYPITSDDARLDIVTAFKVAVDGVRIRRYGWPNPLDHILRVEGWTIPRYPGTPRILMRSFYSHLKDGTIGPYLPTIEDIENEDWEVTVWRDDE